MANAQTVEHKRIELKLTLDMNEARALRCLVQNAQTPQDDAYMNEVRRVIFEALTHAVVN